MKEFLFVYRSDFNNIPAASHEQMQAMSKRWMDWIGSIAAQDKLADKGNRLHNHGHIVRPDDLITNGPYSEIKESIGGYSLVKAGSYEEAIELAKGCPILSIGGNVEVREVNPL